MGDSDEDLIIEYLKGNEQSLTLLIDRYTPQMYNFVVRFVGTSNAPDIVQEIFIKTWKNLKRFNVAKAHFKTWIFTIARNSVTDYLRKKKSIIFSDLDTDDYVFEDILEDKDILPDEVLERLEDTKLLNNLLAQLPQEYQTVLMLYYQEEMTFKEIGLVLKKPLNTVKSHHRRALERLKKMIL